MKPEVWLVRLAVSAVLGGLIGFERQIHGRPAGLRTHMLVCLGATILIIGGISSLGDDPSGSAGLHPDTARLAAGVVTGIGFLGAGAIVRTGELVRGLTTAACIWLVAVIGVVSGLGLFALAGAACLLTLVVLVGLEYLEDRIPPVAYARVSILFEARDMEAAVERSKKGLAGIRGLLIRDIHTSAGALGEGSVEVELFLRVRRAFLAAQVVARLSRMEGVRSVCWKGETE